MSVVRCEKCDRFIDTDYDAEHFDEHEDDMPCPSCGADLLQWNDGRCRFCGALSEPEKKRLRQEVSEE